MFQRPRIAPASPAVSASPATGQPARNQQKRRHEQQQSYRKYRGNEDSRAQGRRADSQQNDTAFPAHSPRLLSAPCPAMTVYPPGLVRVTKLIIGAKQIIKSRPRIARRAALIFYFFNYLSIQKRKPITTGNCRSNRAISIQEGDFPIKIQPITVRNMSTNLRTISNQLKVNRIRFFFKRFVDFSR